MCFGTATASPQSCPWAQPSPCSLPPCHALHGHCSGRQLRAGAQWPRQPARHQTLPTSCSTLLMPEDGAGWQGSDQTGGTFHAVPSLISPCEPSLSPCTPLPWGWRRHTRGWETWGPAWRRWPVWACFCKCRSACLLLRAPVLLPSTWWRALMSPSAGTQGHWANPKTGAGTRKSHSSSGALEFWLAAGMGEVLGRHEI